MLTWPLIFLFIVGCVSLVTAAILFARDSRPRGTGKAPSRANEQFTPRVGGTRP